MAGAIDLFSGNTNLTGANLFKVDKDPLNMLDGGIEDVIGSQALDAGGQVVEVIKTVIKAITGGLGGGVIEVISELEQFFRNLLKFLGDFNPLETALDLIQAGSEFIRKILTPTGLLTTLQDIADEVQKVIDAILGIVGGTFDQLERFFSNLLSFLGLPDFLDGAFDALAAAGRFITNILNPTGLLTTIQTIIDEITKVVNAILGLGNGTWPDLERYFGNLLDFLGLPDFLNAAFSIPAAAIKFITDILMPTNLLATFQNIVDEVQKVIDAILGIAGGTFAQLNTFFGNILRFLGLPDFLDPAFDLIAAIRAFIQNMLHPQNLLAPLDIFGKLPDLNAPKALQDIVDFISDAFNNLGEITGIPSAIDSVLDNIFGIFDTALTAAGLSSALSNTSRQLDARIAALEAAAAVGVPSEAVNIFDDFTRSGVTTTLGNNYTQTTSGNGKMGTDGNGNSYWKTDILGGDAFSRAVHKTQLGDPMGQASVVLSSAYPSTSGAYNYILFRSTASGDTSLRLRIDKSGLQLERIVGSSVMNIGPRMSFSPTPGDLIHIDFSNPDLRTFVMSRNTSQSQTVVDTGNISASCDTNRYAGVAMQAEGVILGQAAPAKVTMFSAAG